LIKRIKAGMLKELSLSGRVILLGLKQLRRQGSAD